MRFTPRTPLQPTRVKYDVIISQNFGRQIDSWRARTQPNGGSEMHTVVVAEGLQRAGLRVAVIQPGPSFVRFSGVDYYSVQDVCKRGLWVLECDALVSQRFGELPTNVEFKRLVVEMHDLPDDRASTPATFMKQVQDSKTLLHSKFNADLYQDWPGKTIIPAAFEDSLFDMPKIPRVIDKRERKFVYGSAALKGLEPTLVLWSELKRNKYEFKKATLIVTSPGYDSPEFDKLRGTPGVVYEQQKTLGDMQMRLARSDGIFMVNVLPETYGCVQAMAEIAGRPAWCLCVNGRGAFDESLANAGWSVHTDPQSFVDAISKPRWPEIKPAHDVRMSTLLPQWLDVLGFDKQKEQAA